MIMSIKINDFFSPIKLDNRPTESDYASAKHYVNAIKIFSQTTYQSVYIIDYYKRGFAYVSDNPLFLCGAKPQTVLNLGYLFYLQNVPEQDLKLLLEINNTGFSFFKNIPREERLQYTISYDFNLTQPDKSLLLVNHKLSPMLLDRDSNIWLALCVVSLSSNHSAGNISIRKLGSEIIHQYNESQKIWNTIKGLKLSKTEKEVLVLSSQGLTMKEIGKKINLSPDTIKFHRISIFNKLHVKNITEAITYAENYMLI